MLRILKKIKFTRHKDWIYFFVFISVILFSVFLLEFKIVGQAVYGDARYYLAFTRSMYFSQNLDISDEMNHYWSPETNNQPSNFESVPDLQSFIKVTSYNFSLGISVIWLPIYFIADLIVIIFSKFDPLIIRNGYSNIYQIALGLGNILFVLTGLVLLANVLLGFYKKKIVMLAIFLITFATNLFYYGAIDAVNSHPFSFFGTSFLLFLYFKYKKRKKIKILFIQGIILGLMVANRMQDGLLIAIPLLTLFSGLNLKKTNIKIDIKKALVLLFGALIGYIPQVILLYLGQEKLLLIPHLYKAQNDFIPFRHVWDILFDQKLGIFFYMPIVLATIFGLILFKKRNNLLGAVYIFMFFSVFILISSYDGWNVAGYTSRYFISIFPILAFGIAEIIVFLKKKYSNIFLFLLSLFFIFHQGLSILVFKLFWQDPTYVGSELSGSGQLKIKIIETIYKYLSSF